MSNEIESAVDQTLCDVLGLTHQDITADFSSASTARWDSARQIMIVLALEDKFKVRFEPDELEQIETRRDIIGILSAKV